MAGTRRGQEITLVASSVSGTEALKDAESPQYKAACWLIHDDLLQVKALDVHVIQRYILAVVFYTLHGGDWNRNYDFLSPSHECEWSKTFVYSSIDSTAGFLDGGEGIHCNKLGQVSGILLGELETSFKVSIILCLSCLRLKKQVILFLVLLFHWLNKIGANHLVGTIPEEISWLDKMGKNED